MPISQLLKVDQKVNIFEITKNFFFCLKMSEDAGVCRNLSSRGIFLRYSFGVIGFAAFVALSSYTVSKYPNFPRYYRLASAFPLFLSSIGFFQGYNKVCVNFVGKNVQELDGQLKPVTSVDLQRALRKVAGKIYWQSAIATLIGTGIVYFI